MPESPKEEQSPKKKGSFRILEGDPPPGRWKSEIIVCLGTKVAKGWAEAERRKQERLKAEAAKSNTSEPKPPEDHS